MILVFNTFHISPFHHYHCQSHHYYQAKDTCMRMKITSKHIKVEIIIMTQNRDQCMWFTQSLGYVHKTLSHKVTFIKIKGLQSATTRLPYFLSVPPPGLSIESISQAIEMLVLNEIFLSFI